jgi:uncharacterized membrane protein YfcA
VNFLWVTFPVSGVETWLFVPPLVAFVISFFTSMGGVSGAFLLLPFQMSFLHFTTPSVSATNQVYNIVAIPGGVSRYINERRMVWPLTLAVVLGTLPGVLLGAWVRVVYLPNPKNFKFFVGFVLVYMGIRLLQDIARRDGKGTGPVGKSSSSRHVTSFSVSRTRFSRFRAEFTFADEVYEFSVPAVVGLCFLVGIIGGIYGIGGGAIVAPILVAVFQLPVYTVAGAALLGTFITSVAGVTSYHVLALLRPETSIAPDWLLGTLFGLGGLAGMYLGARCQKYFPSRVIKAILCFCIFFVAVNYLIEFFR